MTYEVEETEDTTHDKCEVEHIEHIYDNPIERTHWMMCYTCNVQFIHCQSTIVEVIE